MKQIVHRVTKFVARIGVTACGRLSNSVTAHASETTCKACRKVAR